MHGFTENLIATNATISDALRVIDSAAIPIALVHRDGRLVGTVTDGDVRRGLLRGVTPADHVAQVMNARPVTAPENISAADASRIMRQRSILQLPLIDRDGRIVGLKSIAADDNVANAADTTVVIMAGGRGTRLRPITEDIPKPMVEVGGRPILDIIVERFVSQNFKQIFLSVNYKREIIEAYFGDGARFGAHINYLREDRPLGTAGALGLLPRDIKGPLVVMNGDLLARVNFHHLLKFHQEQAASATMGVFEYKHTVPYGVVQFEDQFFHGIVEKPVHRYFVNAGIYVLDPSARDLIPGGRADMPALFERIKAAGQKPAVFPLREYWIDVGRIEDLHQARDDFEGAFPEN
ncbi:MAG: CBS domain-containing protein [Alphaproteobacteria bacterium]|nr:CBS domain-containing protein [Alphaproteobacteria bacterium]